MSKPLVKKIEDIYIESLNLSLKIQSLKSEINNSLNTANELVCLQKAIKRGGLTKSLLYFVNQNNILSETIPSIPSLESFTKDLSIEDSQQAVEDLSSTINTIYEKTIGQMVKLFDHVITSIKIKNKSIPAIRKRIETFEKEVSNKSFNSEKLKKIEGLFNSYSSLLELIDHSKNSESAIVEVLNIPLPKTKEDFDVWESSFNNFETKYKENYEGIKSNSFKYKVHSKTSLADKGYNEESFSQIVVKLNECISENLSSESELAAKISSFKKEAWNIIDPHSINIKIPVEKTTTESGVTTTNVLYYRYEKHYTELGKLLLRCFRNVIYDIEAIEISSFRNGILNAMTILGKLKQAYK